jgi:hypothetical protein
LGASRKGTDLDFSAIMEMLLERATLGAKAEATARVARAMMTRNMVERMSCSTRRRWELYRKRNVIACTN